MSRTVPPVVPKGEAIRKAVKWLAEQHRYDPQTLEEACRRFDLSPLEEDFILSHFAQPPDADPARPPQ